MDNIIFQSCVWSIYLWKAAPPNFIAATNINCDDWSVRGTDFGRECASVCRAHFVCSDICYPHHRHMGAGRDVGGGDILLPTLHRLFQCHRSLQLRVFPQMGVPHLPGAQVSRLHSLVSTIHHHHLTECYRPYKVDMPKLYRNCSNKGHFITEWYVITCEFKNGQKRRHVFNQDWDVCSKYYANHSMLSS